MILAIVNMKAGNYYLQRAFLKPLQEMSTCLTPAFFTDDGGKHAIHDHKPPKTSFANNESLSGFENLLHIYSPAASRLYFSEPFQSLPEVFTEIIVPPKILPHTTFIFNA